MKNVQVIDSADNCTFAIFGLTDDEFALIFPQDGQDIQFAEDLSGEALKALEPAWQRPVLKSAVAGINGTLFYGFGAKRGHFPPTKREADWNESALNDAQRRMYRQLAKGSQA